MHAYHPSCILPWLRRKSRCPTCKARVLLPRAEGVPAEQEEEEEALCTCSYCVEQRRERERAAQEVESERQRRQHQALERAAAHHDQHSDNYRPFWLADENDDDDDDAAGLPAVGGGSGEGGRGPTPSGAGAEAPENGARLPALDVALMRTLPADGSLWARPFSSRRSLSAAVAAADSPSWSAMWAAPAAAAGPGRDVREESDRPLGRRPGVGVATE